MNMHPRLLQRRIDDEEYTDNLVKVYPVGLDQNTYERILALRSAVHQPGQSIDAVRVGRFRIIDLYAKNNEDELVVATSRIDEDTPRIDRAPRYQPRSKFSMSWTPTNDAQSYATNVKHIQEENHRKATRAIERVKAYQVGINELQHVFKRDLAIVEMADSLNFLRGQNLDRLRTKAYLLGGCALAYVDETDRYWSGTPVRFDDSKDKSEARS